MLDIEKVIKEGVEQAMKDCELTIGMTLKQAVEKQTPKKPVPYFSDEYKCPICDSLVNLSSGYKQPFCYECGQKIDWSDTE